MAKLAVIQTGGKQYTVKEGDKIKIEKLEGEVGSEVKIDTVLLTSSEDGKDLELGTPIIEGASVTLKIVEQYRERKIRVVKYKAKTRQHKVHGHRQHKTKVEVISL